MCHAFDAGRVLRPKLVPGGGQPAAGSVDDLHGAGLVGLADVLMGDTDSKIGNTVTIEVVRKGGGSNVDCAAAGKIAKSAVMIKRTKMTTPAPSAGKWPESRPVVAGAPNR